MSQTFFKGRVLMLAIGLILAMSTVLWAKPGEKNPVSIEINVKSSIKRAVPGQAITFTVEIENKGSMMVTNLDLKCRMPEIFLFVEGKGASEFNDKKSDRSKGIIQFDSLPLVSAGEKLTYKVVCEPQEPGIVRFRASTSFDQHATGIYDEEIIVIRTGK